MTKLLHAADLHMGRLTWGRPDDDGIPSSVVSVARCWAAAVDVALDRQVEGVVLAGDIFDQRNPDAAAIVLFERQLRRLQVPTLIIAGNHDAGDPSVLEAFESPLVYVSTRPQIIDFAGLKVGTLPHVRRRNLMAGPEFWKARAADAGLAEQLERILAWYAEADVEVVVGHWSVAGCVVGDSETDVSIIDEPLIKPEALEPFRYAAMGHLHKHQPTNGAAFPDGFYPGSIDRMTFAEENDPKGVIEVELPDDDSPRATFHNTPARRLLTIRTHENGGTWPYEGPVEGAVVRLEVTTDDEAARVDQARAALLRAGAELVTVADRRKRTVKPRDEGMTEQLGPVEALDRWLAHRGIEEDRRARIRDRAAAL